MKKYLLISVSGVIMAGAFILFQTEWAKAIAGVISLTQQQTASTTVAYIAEGAATTTWQFDNRLDDTIGPRYLFAQFTASSSASSIFRCKFTFSNNTIDWYEEDIDTINSVYAFGDNIRHATSTVFHTWQAATTTIDLLTGNDVVLRTIPVPFIASKYGRIACDMEPQSNSAANTTGGYLSLNSGFNGAMYMEATLVEELR